MLSQFRYALAFFLLFFISTTWAEIPIPALSHRVTDLTATLSVEQNTTLENKLAAFEAKKGSQIAVLILPTTQPETIEAFGIRVFDAWKIGRKKVDDGVILIVAKNDRKLRLEVGKGLEGAIPDAIAKRILANTIKPYFKNNDYAGGIDAGVNQIISLIEKENLPEVKTEPLSSWEVLGILTLFVVGIAGFFWLVIRSILAIFRFFSSKSSGKKSYRDRDNDSSRFWSNSSSSDWSSSDSSSSSSDWSGGGGESSGGGASDSW